MAGATLPADAYISDDTRTEGEVKASLDAMVSVTRRLLGSTPPEALSIASGVVTPTGASGALVLDTEGAVGADDLDRIAITNLLDGSSIAILNTSGNVITVKHEDGGSGQISLRGGVDTVLGTGVVLELFLDGTIWRQLTPDGDDPAPLLSYLGIGTAGLKDDGSGNGLDADTLDGVHGAGFLLATAQATDSLKLDGYFAASYARLDLTSEQVLAGDLRTESGRIRADNDTAGQSSGFEWKIQDVLRAAATFDDIGDEWILTIYETDGTTAVCRVKIDADDGILKYDPDASGTYYDVRHKGEAFQDLAKIVTIDSPVTISAEETIEPISGLDGVTFPTPPDGSRKFEVTGGVGIEADFSGGGFAQAQVRVHLGTSGDETDTAIFTSSIVEGFTDPKIQVEIPPLIISPGASDLLTVSIWISGGGSLVSGSVVTTDDLRAADRIGSSDIDGPYPSYLSTQLKIVAF